jgi:N-carbamoyl-L-amino-acid hydrolase
MSSRAHALAPVAERVERDLLDLSRIRDPDSGGWTRTVFSEPYRESRGWVRSRMREAGLEVHTDAAGKPGGGAAGAQPSGGGSVTGSHTDTVESGGRFDGVVGVLGALEVVRLGLALAATECEPDHISWASIRSSTVIGL